MQVVGRRRDEINEILLLPCPGIIATDRRTNVRNGSVYVRPENYSKCARGAIFRPAKQF